MRLPDKDQDYFAGFEKRANRMFRGAIIAAGLYLGLLATFIVGVVWAIIKVLQFTEVL